MTESVHPGRALSRAGLLIASIALSLTVENGLADPAVENSFPGRLTVYVGEAEADSIANDKSSIVQVLLYDADAVEKLRVEFSKLGLSGRAWVDQWQGPALPFADSIVNQLIIGKSASSRVGLTEATRVLAPGGIIKLEGQPAPAKLPPELTARIGDETILTKCRPDDVDDWRSFEHDAGRTGVSSDKKAGPPRGLRWMTGEDWPRYITFSTSGPGFVSFGGRNFYWTAQTTAFKPKPKHELSRLSCRDAYNGLLQWERTFPCEVVPTAMATDGERLYIQPSWKKLMSINPALGETIKEYDNSISASLILACQGVLIQYGSGKMCALDAADRNKLWERTFLPRRYSNDAIASADGIVALLESAAKDKPFQLTALDLRTGKANWTVEVDELAPKNDPQRDLSLVCMREGIIVLADAQRSFRPNDKKCGNYAFSAKDGRELWRITYNPTDHGGRATSVMLIDGLAWIKSKDGWLGLDALTGAEKKKIKDARTACYPDHATQRYLLSGKMDFVDIQTQTSLTFDAARSSCAGGFFPANGLIYSLPTRCHCYPMVRGYLGLSPEPAADRSAASKPAEEQSPEKGPAWGSVSKQKGPDEKAWPCYRLNAYRGAAAGQGAFDAQSKMLWQSEKLSFTLSAPTSDGNLVFVGGRDRPEVAAIKLADGKIAWRYPAGGIVDSPPTYADGRVVFGCVDGNVYCLSAEDGRLIWRFRAAPAERKIVCDGRLESVWPLHGSLPVMDNSVYALAGRHSRLDGGMFLFRLDLATGKVQWRRSIASDSISEMADLLVCADMLYLGSLTLDYQTGQTRSGTEKSALWAPMGLLRDSSEMARNSGEDNWRTQWGLPPRKGTAPISAFVGHAKFSKIPTVRAKMIAFADADARTVFGMRQDEKTLVSSVFQSDAQGQEKWTVKLEGSAVVNGMAVVADKIVLAGWLDENNARNGKIWILSAADGSSQGELGLPALPIWDGLAFANGRLIISLSDGTIECIGSRE